ncbi:uncharacterized protein BO95DRAFT_442046 [Aspergillus brunneoviolaceus CBS 621.78]|uniref:Uncharacterized protein n=1 Tax=Aspergillus brunneoviolaceus CBS 621.78 TaxID=1450534 RepID=A0ACD1GBE1_9EURO|nr:hypothetical protein BO95DRAFT_442046 [Aspergillus brunneoviolaceus CBS 621.78]RAH46532.1 hypothetical protein BO95DRAFT_442046 [Aspergillus brunneoviolaceus CBS 621.78]
MGHEHVALRSVLPFSVLIFPSSLVVLALFLSVVANNYSGVEGKNTQIESTNSDMIWN